MNNNRVVVKTARLAARCGPALTKRGVVVGLWMQPPFFVPLYLISYAASVYMYLSGELGYFDSPKTNNTITSLKLLHITDGKTQARAATILPCHFPAFWSVPA